MHTLRLARAILHQMVACAVLPMMGRSSQTSATCHRARLSCLAGYRKTFSMDRLGSGERLRIFDFRRADKADQQLFLTLRSESGDVFDWSSAPVLDGPIHARPHDAVSVRGKECPSNSFVHG